MNAAVNAAGSPARENLAAVPVADPAADHALDAAIDAAIGIGQGERAAMPAREESDRAAPAEEPAAVEDGAGEASEKNGPINVSEFM